MRVKGKRSAAIVAGLLFSHWAAGDAPSGGDRPAAFLGSYDFVAGAGDGLAVSFVPDAFKVESYDGHRLLRIERREHVAVTIEAGQDQPDFPRVNLEEAGQAEALALRLTILEKARKGIDPKRDDPLLVILKLYDVGYAGSFGGKDFMVRGHGGEAVGTTSGSHWAREPWDRQRLLEKTYRLSGERGKPLLLDGYFGGADLEIAVHNYLYLQRVEVYRLDQALYDRHEAGLKEITRKQFELVKRRSLVEDRSFQAERVGAYLRGWGGRLRVQPLAAQRAELLAAFLELETAVDDYYYQGRAAVARADRAALAGLDGALQQRVGRIEGLLDGLEAETAETTARAYQALREIERLAWFAPVSLADQPAPHRGNKVNPSERILIIGFDLYGDHPSWFTRAYQSLGISADFVAYPQRGLLEDGTFAGAAQRDQVYDTKRFDGMPWLAMSSRHFYIPVGGESQYGGLPKWFVDKYEKTEDLWAWNGAGEVKGRVNGFNDKVLEYFRRYHRRIAEDYRNAPEFFAVQIAAEGQQYLPAKGACENGYSPSARRKFRAFLQAQYGTVEKLNEAAGTAYAAFEAIEPPPDIGLKLRRQAGPLDYEFERFRRSGLTTMVAEGTREIKAVNPELKVWFESSGRFDMTVPHGYDTYALFKTADIASTHAGGRFNPIWNMSVHRYNRKGIYGKEECNAGSPAAHSNPKVEWLRAAKLEGFLLELFCGNRCLGAWHQGATACRGLEGYGSHLYDKREHLQPLRSAGSLAVIRKRADLWLPVLNAARWRPPRLGMLYSTTTQLIGWPYQEQEQEAFAIHNWMYYGGFPYLVAHEDALVDGCDNLNGYNVLVAPFATHTRHELDDAYIRWIRNGGTLISSGPFGVYNQYGRKDLGLLREVFGDLEVEYAADEMAGGNKLSADSIAWLRDTVGDGTTTAAGGWFWKVSLKEKKDGTRVLLALEDGTPVLLEGRLGAGRVLFSACGLGQNGLAKFLLAEIGRRVRPFARARKDGGLAVLPLADAARHIWLGVMNTDYERPVSDTIRIDARVGRVVDLGVDRDCPVPVRHDGLATEFDVELAPGDGTLLDLGLEADMVAEVRMAGQDLPPAASAGPSLERYEEALREIERSRLEPEAKREAFALAAIGKRLFSLGAAARAERCLARGLAVRAAPAFVRLEGDVVPARRAKAPVKLDGELDEWTDVPAVPLKGSALSGGLFKAMWDESALYVAVAVRDADVKACDEQGIGVNWRWGFDGVTLRVNTSDTGELLPTDAGTMLPCGYQAVSLAVSGRKSGYPLSLCVSPANVRFAAKRIEGGYVLEAAIPAREYGILPVAGASIGFDLQLHGAVGTFCRYSKREGALYDGRRLGRLQFTETGR